ncbi:MAG: hypothetical protein J2P41_18875 [Blastocatellia bacterium]|nr:hypothetical protein [Blastocatellia bacterium]
MSSILISILLSISPYHWSQDGLLKKEDLKVIMYLGVPPEWLANLPEEIRKSEGLEKPPLLVAKVAADGKFKAASPWTTIEGQITKIDGDRMEVIIQQPTSIKATVSLSELIMPKMFSIPGPIYYFGITKNIGEREAKPGGFRPQDEKSSSVRPTLKLRPSGNRD